MAIRTYVTTPPVALALALALAGCGDSGAPGDSGTSEGTTAGTDTDSVASAGSSSGGTDPGSTSQWWMTTTDSDGVGSQGSQGSQGEETEGEETEGEEETEEEPEEDHVIWFGEGLIMPGVSFTEPYVEFIAFANQEDQCIIGGLPTNIEWLDSCANCEFAFRFTITEVEVHVDTDCASYGMDPMTVEGMQRTVGYDGGELLYTEVDGVWVESGEAFYEMPESFFEWVEFVEQP